MHQRGIKRERDMEEGWGGREHLLRRLAAHEQEAEVAGKHTVRKRTWSTQVQPLKVARMEQQQLLQLSGEERRVDEALARLARG